jgi:hypothetical protein
MAGAGLALAPSAFAGQAARPGRAVIRTLLRDIEPASLTGRILFHEHLSMRYPLGAEQHFTDDVPMMIEEVRAAAGQGIGCIVDGGHADMARSLAALRRIATESGLPVVASGGYYMQRTYPPDVAARSADQLADELAREALAERLGAFGEIGQQGGVMTADERKMFEAVGKAHVKTGLPIFTHNAYLGTRPGAPTCPAMRRSGSWTRSRPPGHSQRTLPSATSAAWTIRRRKSRAPSRSVARTSASIA